jgi:hypothetical protein
MQLETRELARPQLCGWMSREQTIVRMNIYISMPYLVFSDCRLARCVAFLSTVIYVLSRPQSNFQVTISDKVIDCSWVYHQELS